MPILFLRNVAIIAVLIGFLPGCTFTDYVMSFDAENSAYGPSTFADRERERLEREMVREERRIAEEKVRLKKEALRLQAKEMEVKYGVKDVHYNLEYKAEDGPEDRMAVGTASNDMFMSATSPVPAVHRMQPINDIPPAEASYQTMSPESVESVGLLPRYPPQNPNEPDYSTVEDVKGFVSEEDPSVFVFPLDEAFIRRKNSSRTTMPPPSQIKPAYSSPFNIAPNQGP